MAFFPPLISLSPTGKYVQPLSYHVDNKSLVNLIDSPFVMTNDILNAIRLGATSTLTAEDIFFPAFLNRNNLYVETCEYPNIKQHMTQKYYYKFIDKWLASKKYSKHLLKYLKYANGKVSIIDDKNNPDNYEANSSDVINKKIQFIEDELISMDDMHYILDKLIGYSQLSWCSINTMEDYIRDAVEGTFKKRILKRIKLSKKLFGK